MGAQGGEIIPLLRMGSRGPSQNCVASLRTCLLQVSAS